MKILGKYSCVECENKWTRKWKNNKVESKVCDKCSTVVINYDNKDSYETSQKYYKWTNYDKIFGNLSLEDLLKLGYLE